MYIGITHLLHSRLVKSIAGIVNAQETYFQCFGINMLWY